MAGTGLTNRRLVFPASLLITMTASAYQLFVLAVLASPLIDDLDMSRAQLGLVGSINPLLGALSAPVTGRLTDRIGARRSVVTVLVLSAAGMGAMAAAPNPWWLGIAALIGGIPQGWGNPATNSLIATRVAVGRRGAVTGIKQSGVTLGVFLSGATMPAMATAWGWRASVWVFAIAFVGIALAVHVTLGPDPEAPVPAPEPDDVDRGRAPVDPFIWRLALYALLMGTAGGAAGRFFPLFAEESVGLSTEAAGMLVAIGGLLGMAARVQVGHWAETRIAPTLLLGILAIVGVVYCVLLAVVTPSTRGLLLLSPPLSAVGIAAWNAVAMLAIIMFVSTTDSGRASGIVMLGFLGGLTISAPIAGLTVDTFDTYRPVWIAAAALAASAALLMLAQPSGEQDTASRAKAVSAPQ